jgi:hypothetical protein
MGLGEMVRAVVFGFLLALLMACFGFAQSPYGVAAAARPSGASWDYGLQASPARPYVAPFRGPLPIPYAYLNGGVYYGGCVPCYRGGLRVHPNASPSYYDGVAARMGKVHESYQGLRDYSPEGAAFNAFPTPVVIENPYFRKGQ